MQMTSKCAAGLAMLSLKTLAFIILASAMLLGCISSTVAAAPKDPNDYSKRILGRWLGPRKFEIFNSDGSWSVQRNEDSKPDTGGRRWHIQGNQLILTYPGDHGMDTGIYTIVSFTQRRFVTEVDGYRQTYDRFP